MKVKAYAKLNLGLGVLGKREDGYHEISTLTTPISLADEIQVNLLQKPFVTVDMQKRVMRKPKTVNDLEIIIVKQKIIF